MERSTVAQEETGVGDKRVERTEVNYEVTASDNLNSDLFGGEYNVRDTCMSRGIIDTGGGEQMSHAGSKYDLIMMHGCDRGIIHVSDNGIHQQSSDHGLLHALCDRSYNKSWYTS